MRSISSHKISAALGCLLLSLTSGCAFMPSVGPHASYIEDQVEDKKAPPLYDVDVKLASQLADKVRIEKDNKERNLLALLNDPIEDHAEKRISSGDSVRITLWMQGTGGGQVASSEGGSETASTSPGSMAPNPSKMGTFIVDGNGRIDIPYAGFVNIGHLTPHQAQTLIRQRLAATHEFENLEISLQLVLSHDQNIVVMGAVNKPTIIDWNEAGLELTEAIAQSGGYTNSDTLHTNNATSNGDNIGVSVLLARKGTTYDIPLHTALLHPIALNPGDRVLVQRKASVRILCLGAGWTQPRLAGFSEIPTLSQVMASIGGLNPQTAQGRALFILKHDRTVMYKINFDRVEGMEASQILPIEDGDMIYIPVARSVTMQQVLGMFMFIAGQGAGAAAAR